MGKTADLTVVQKMTIDTLHKEGKTQKVIAKEAGCSQSSVSKHINREAKGRKRCGRKNPLLNNRQHQKRLAWAKDKKDWTAAELSKVMFSDESKFCISFGNQGPRVWRKRGEAQNPCCLRSSVKFPQSVMVWGAISSAGVAPLCFLRSKVNAAVYQDVFEHFMLPAADQLYGDSDFIFQQDLAPAHSAKATSTWFKDHEELKATIRATWALITPEQCNRLIDSMPHRIAAVIQAKGAPTKY
ncbi:Transposable element Tc1 transposase [Labeo rohita]|uniref:Transposable element Tc1 transposase n=1 Tax=Labeo rohita TaxID=84645 RepID=A0ABQ8KYZ1_LABRO|nr:Transposable element Tc1 transposase [Labeo rohita]